MGVDENAGVEVGVAFLVGWSAATPGGLNIPVDKRPITLIPMKRLIDRYEAFARNLMFFSAATNICKKGATVIGFS